MKTRILLPLCLFLQIPFLLQAAHILGGQMSYTHLNGNTYSIELVLYRDCMGGGAQLDNPALVAIYTGAQEPYNYLYQFAASANSVVEIDAIQASCFGGAVPFCIEKGTYTYELTFPNSTDVYQIIYQRCCRNPLFSNLANPEETGFTIATEINTKAQELDNSSPVLNDVPFFEICDGNSFEIDFSASDSDADSLVYELCHPITGGGPEGTADNPGDPGSCNGVQPTPACPPPFGLVDFISSYTATEPMGNISQLSIDRYSGLISGEANQIGQFLAGVCISEYIDGEVVSFSQQELVFRVDVMSSTESYKVGALSVFPNPATEKTYIELPSQSEHYELTVRDLNGRIISPEVESQDGLLAINTSGLSGIYLLEIKTKGAVYVNRILVF